LELRLKAADWNNKNTFCLLNVVKPGFIFQNEMNIIFHELSTFFKRNFIKNERLKGRLHFPYEIVII